MDKVLLSDIKQYVNYLMVSLDNLYYHHYEHALGVMERAIYLGTMEGCSENEIEMLAIAALFHDTGFIIEYENNEVFGAKIARNYLKTILYPVESIEIIEKIILATAPKKEPQNLLEKIIKDADMDNLGTEDFFSSSEKLKHEREIIHNIKIKDPDWRHALLNMIEGYRFYTGTESKERSEKLEKNTEKLRKQLLK